MWRSALDPRCGDQHVSRRRNGLVGAVENLSPIRERESTLIDETLREMTSEIEAGHLLEKSLEQS